MGGSALAVSACVPGSLGTVGSAFAPPESELRQAADASWQRIRSERPTWRNGAANRRAQNVARRLIPLTGEPNLPWEVVLFDDSAINAFALPNGKIGIYRGMMVAVENDDQLAAVIGHELGHVTADHAAQRVGTQQMSRLGAALVGSALGASPQQANEIAGLLGMGATYGVILPFSRQQELEADRIGVRYMASAGYQPIEALEFWQDRMVEAGRGGPTEFLSTHPSDQARIQQLQQILYG
ncbi:MAG: M48 family metallopeptidase [Pseudomonadota bacterium]